LDKFGALLGDVIDSSLADIATVFPAQIAIGKQPSDSQRTGIQLSAYYMTLNGLDVGFFSWQTTSSFF